MKKLGKILLQISNFEHVYILRNKTKAHIHFEFRSADFLIPNLPPTKMLA